MSNLCKHRMFAAMKLLLRLILMEANCFIKVTTIWSSQYFMWVTEILSYFIIRIMLQWQVVWNWAISNNLHGLQSQVRKLAHIISYGLQERVGKLGRNFIITF